MTVVALDAHLSAGVITSLLTDPDLDVPTTIARFSAPSGSGRAPGGGVAEGGAPALSP